VHHSGGRTRVVAGSAKGAHRFDARGTQGWG
jgi:hypothetical protein